MTEDDVKKLIEQSLAPALKAAFGEFQTYFQTEITKVVKPIAEKLDEFEVATTPEPEQPKTVTDNPEVNALMERLKAMEERDKARDAEVKQHRFSTALGKSIGGKNPLHADIVTELLSTRYKDTAFEKNGEWYLPSGEKLAEAVESFFSSDKGLHFLPNPGGSSLGTGKEAAKPSPKSEKTTLENMLSEMVF